MIGWGRDLTTWQFRVLCAVAGAVFFAALAVVVSAATVKWEEDDLTIPNNGTPIAQLDGDAALEIVAFRDGQNDILILDAVTGAVEDSVSHGLGFLVSTETFAFIYDVDNDALAELLVGAFDTGATTPGWVTVLELTVPTSAAMPQDLSMEPKVSISPTPAHGWARTHIDFTLPKTGWTTVGVWNVAGQPVENLFSGFMEAGERSVYWDAEGVAAGVYFIKISGEDFTVTDKQVVVR